MSMTTETKSDVQVQMNFTPKSVCVWKGKGVIHAERVMNYQLQRIRNERCIEEGCHARKFKSGMCKRHSKVVQ